MAIAVVGDVHGNIDLMLEKIGEINRNEVKLSIDDFKDSNVLFNKVKDVNKTSKIEAILQVGDLGTFIDESKLDKATIKHGGLGDFKDYYNGINLFTIPTYFCKGNHEDFDILKSFEARFPNPIINNLFYIPNGNAFELNGLKIGVLGGNFGYSCYNLDKNNKRIYGTRRRRHFNYQDIEALKKHKNLDIILAHDAPNCLAISKDYREFGSKYLAELINETQPKYYFFGHYHRHYEEKLGRTNVICLDKIDGKDKSVFVLE